MQLIHFIEITILLKYLFLFRYGVIGNKQSLVVTESNGEFRLKVPYKYDSEKSKRIAYFKASEDENVYHFCPDYHKQMTNALYKLEKIKPNTESEDFNRCAKTIPSIFVEVKNPRELKSDDDDAWNDEIKLYHCGFLLYQKDLYLPEHNHPREVKIEYAQEWSSDYEFLLHTEIYYNTKIEQTSAIKYKLLSTTLPIIKKPFVKEIYLINHRVKTVAPSILIYFGSNQYIKKFNKKIHENLTNKDKYNIDENSLFLTQFASINHFPIPTWERTSRFYLNLVPLSQNTERKWNIVEKYAVMVANNFGDLEITAGITGTMSLSSIEVVDPDGFKMAKYFWKAFEYRNENEVYGILVILHCNPFEKTESKICEDEIDCKTNGWPISNEDFQSGQIYCCEMKKENIEKLKADYLSLENRAIFNLYNWAEKKDKFFKEFFDSDKNLIENKLNLN